MSVVCNGSVGNNVFVNVLIVDPDTEPVDHLVNRLSMYCLYKIVKVNSYKEAINIFEKSDGRIICVTELLADSDYGDGLLLIKKYSKNISFVVFTKSTSASKGANCIKFGAREVFDKTNVCEYDAIITCVHELAIIQKINSGFNRSGSDTIDVITRNLFEQNPETVTAWANYSGISDRQLRNVFLLKTGLGAKDALKMYKYLRSQLGNQSISDKKD